jgi:prevent-host-death family protein
MREVGGSKARIHFSALLDEVARGETIIITRRARPVAWLRPPQTPGRQSAIAAAATLRDEGQR